MTRWDFALAVAALAVVVVATYLLLPGV